MTKRIMHYTSTHPFFRSLSPKDVEKFRIYARMNHPPSKEDWPLTHPVCRAEWRKLGQVDNNYPLTSEEEQVED